MLELTARIRGIDVSPQLIALLCLLNAIAIVFVCICRLNKMHKNVVIGARIHYVALMAGVLAHGFQAIFFQEFPTTGGFILQTAVSVSLAAGFFRWRTSVPHNSDKPLH